MRHETGNIESVSETAQSVSAITTGLESEDGTKGKAMNWVNDLDEEKEHFEWKRKELGAFPPPPSKLMLRIYPSILIHKVTFCFQFSAVPSILKGVYACEDFLYVLRPVELQLTSEVTAKRKAKLAKLSLIIFKAGASSEIRFWDLEFSSLSVLTDISFTSEEHIECYYSPTSSTSTRRPSSYGVDVLSATLRTKIREQAKSKFERKRGNLQLTKRLQRTEAYEQEGGPANEIDQDQLDADIEHSLKVPSSRIDPNNYVSKQPVIELPPSVVNTGM
uniref:Uncharacterized protein n=1 Tax=Parascaris equorum TaxID=6256 RepID=A0A914S075_PAREQ